MSLPELRFTRIEHFAAVDEPGAEPLASAPGGGVVIPSGGVVLVYGSGGAGKTTLVLDLCFALTGGDSWLGLVEPGRHLRVAIIENEGPRPEFRRKIRAKLASADLEPGCPIFVLEDPWSELTLADESHRRALALALVEHETDLLVLGPLVSAGEFPNGGTPDEIRRFEEHIADIRQLVERPFAIVLVHHENRAGQVSGAWERMPDTLLHVTPQGNGRTRIFWQKARWASALHGTATQLVWADTGETFQVEERNEVTEEGIAEQLVEAVRDHPGLSWTRLRDLRDDAGVKRVRGGATKVEDARDRLLASGTLVNLATVEGRFALHLADDPLATRSGAGTGWERLPFPSPADDADPNRSPFASIEGTGGNGTGPAEPETEDDDLLSDVLARADEELEWRS